MIHLDLVEFVADTLQTHFRGTQWNWSWIGDSSSVLWIWTWTDWIGLDWIGLDWIGLDWIGLEVEGDFSPSSSSRVCPSIIHSQQWMNEEELVDE